MPIQAFGVSITDEEIFPWLNGVLVGWLLLAVAPRWSKTQPITTLVALVYAVLYVALLVPVLLFGDGSVSFTDFGTLQGVRKALAHKDVTLGAWDHYVVFDLWTGKWIAADAQARGVPHLLVLPCLFATLMLGPSGLLLYFLIRPLFSTKAIKQD
eukprot:jgi/Botrbrau1/22648/Bobra.176_1s0070.1